MEYVNKGVGGGTIKSNTYNGDVKRHWIAESVSTIAGDSDYVIVEGGVNDGLTNLGSISNGFNAELDMNTFYGAFESMCKTLTTRFAGKKVGYIFVHRMASYFDYQGDKDNNLYWAAMECLNKWGIPYIDLNKSCPPFASFSADGDAELYALRTKYTVNGDGWHPTDEGYKKYYCDKIEAWMNSL